MTGASTNSTADLKSRLAALLRQGHADERAFGDSLSPEDRERTGTVDAWAPKEIIAHLAYWRDREAERAHALARGETPPSFQDFLRLNTESFTDLAANSWDQAIASSYRSIESLIAAMEILPDAALVGQVGAPESPVPITQIATIIGNGYQHPQQHLAELTAARGDAAGASAIHHRMLDAVVALNVSSEITATARYNLACALAARGPRAEVIALLRQSFADRPQLIEFARQDTDLDPLRDDADFQALTTEG